MQSAILWTVFGVIIVTLLALDLGVFHKQPRAASVREALAWTGVYVAIGLAFAAGIHTWVDPDFLAVTASQPSKTPSLEYLACYVTEYALSVDNIFVFLVIFSYFAVPEESRHRVLFWGIFGAMLTRGAFLFAGVAAIQHFHWVMWVLGVLLIVTAVKLGLKREDDEIEPEKNVVLRLARRRLRVTSRFHGSKFFVKEDGRLLATPLFLTLLVVETTDVVFALDSVPAALGISQNMFVVYTSNIFAILGLRSLFFAVGGLVRYLHYLKYGLALVLAFVGVKMLLPEQHKLPIGVALSVVVGILFVTVIASMVRARIVASRTDGRRTRR